MRDMQWAALLHLLNEVLRAMLLRCGRGACSRIGETGDISHRTCVNRSAFSLLELLLTLAIIATLSAIAVPRFGMSAVRYRADLAAHRVVCDLQLVRSTARAGSSSRNVEFRPNQDDYVISGIIPLDPHMIAYTVDLRDRPYEAALVSAEFGGDSAVTFNGWGLPDSGGTVVLSVGAEQRTIVLDAETGEASVQ